LSINCLKGKITSGEITQQQYDRIESLYKKFETTTATNPRLRHSRQHMPLPLPGR
jgi:hypothetical protein